MISSAVKYKPHRVEGGIEFTKVSDYDESNIVWSSTANKEEDSTIRALEDLFAGENISKLELTIIAFKVMTQCSWEYLSEWLLTQSGYNVDMSVYKLKKLCRSRVSKILDIE
tara:strand:+ start:65 stop:400 length:336 start_codon:yes stop_codon:yes gene_type:complete